MQLKLLEFQPYISNNDPQTIFGEIAYVKDSDNNVLFYYLISKPDPKIDEDHHSIMIAGYAFPKKFIRIENARQYCQQHFRSLLNMNISQEEPEVA